MTIDGINGLIIRYRDMIGLDSDQSSILLVSLIDSNVASASTTLIEKPQVGQSCNSGTGNIADAFVSKPRQKIIQHRKEKKRK